MNPWSKTVYSFTSRQDSKLVEDDEICDEFQVLYEASRLGRQSSQKSDKSSRSYTKRSSYEIAAENRMASSASCNGNLGTLDREELGQGSSYFFHDVFK